MTALEQAIAKAVDAAISKMAPAKATVKAKKGKGRAKLTDAQRETYRKANDAECIKVFTAAGYKDVQPRINVKVYGKIKKDGTKTGWIAENRKVKKGEKSHDVNGFALFHIDQTEPMAEQKVAA